MIAISLRERLGGGVDVRLDASTQREFLTALSMLKRKIPPCWREYDAGRRIWIVAWEARPDLDLWLAELRAAFEVETHAHQQEVVTYARG